MCYSWHAIATPYLYQNVVLRRVGQVPALVRTLKDNIDFCPMIRYLTFSCDVPREWDDVMNNGMTYLLKECSNVQSLSLHGLFTEWLQGKQAGCETRRFRIQDEILLSATSITDICYMYTSFTHQTDSFKAYHVFSSLPNIKSLQILHVYDLSQECHIIAFNSRHLSQIRSNPKQFSSYPWFTDLSHFEQLELYRVSVPAESLTDVWSTLESLSGSLKDIHIILDQRETHQAYKNFRLSRFHSQTYVDHLIPALTDLETKTIVKAKVEHENRAMDVRYSLPRCRLFDYRLQGLLGLLFLFPPAYSIDPDFVEEPWSKGKVYTPPPPRPTAPCPRIIEDGNFLQLKYAVAVLYVYCSAHEGTLKLIYELREEPPLENEDKDEDEPETDSDEEWLPDDDSSSEDTDESISEDESDGESVHSDASPRSIVQLNEAEALARFDSTHR